MLTRALLLAAIFCFVAAPGASQSKPNHDPNLESLARQVMIHRDSFGVPHVFGRTDASVVFGLMYAQCEDNFWQLETDFIRSIGRAAEIDGEKSLASDLAYRAFEVEKLSKAEYQRLPAKSKTLCDAFAAGLNYFIARNPQIKPRLITRFEPWHILAFNRMGRISGLGRIGLRPGEIRIGALEPAGAPQTDHKDSDLDLTALHSWFDEMKAEPLEGSNTSGNTFVSVVECGKQLRARSILVFGQSAAPKSPHHTDQAELYAQGKFKDVRFTLKEIKANLERICHPGDAR
jgi:acyl-homoserine lactone acylase PvdQ